jgi:hypothetical protein
VTVADRRPFPLPASLIPLKNTKAVGSSAADGVRLLPISCTVT